MAYTKGLPIHWAERLKCGLRALGYRDDYNARSNKYWAFYHPDGGHKAFVGPSGALRLGPCASQSYSIGDPTNITRQYNAVLNAEIMRAVVCCREQQS